MSCQTGVWAVAQGSGKTGLQGVFYPLRGKSISCAWSGITFGASVSANGDMTLNRYFNFGGWTYCPGASVCGTVGQAQTYLTATGINGVSSDGVIQCAASWPSS